ncbi:MAG TPA: hypothetical protein VF509_09195 [Sphingobium sp.]
MLMIACFSDVRRQTQHAFSTHSIEFSKQLVFAILIYRGSALTRGGWAGVSRFSGRKRLG